SRHPLSRAKYLLYARAMAATLKQTAAANARLNRVVHMSRSYDCRRKRDRSLCHRRLYRCVLWPVMAEAAPYSWDCPGEFDVCRRSHGTVELREPRTVPIFELGLVLSRTLTAAMRPASPASCRPAGLRRCASRASRATRLGRCW